MRDPQRLRAVQRTLRETHRKLHDLQGASIASLRETLEANRLMLAANQDALAGATRLIASTREAFLGAQRALESTTKTVAIVSEAHDAMTVLYESDDELDDITHEESGT